jgi:hypothetical protein
MHDDSSIGKRQWMCHQCSKQGECDFCETCAEHCAGTPNELDTHQMDVTLASVDPERKPS